MNMGNAVDILKGLIWGFVLCALITLVSGCRSVKYVPVETVRTEDRTVTKEVHDTVAVYDTRIVYVKGDTVVDLRYRDRWRIETVHDTMVNTVRSEVPVPYPVEKRMTKWERFKIDYSGYAIFVLSFGMVIVVWLLKKSGG